MRLVPWLAPALLLACGKNKDSDSEPPTSGPTAGSWTTHTGGSGTTGGLPTGKHTGGSGGSGLPVSTAFVGDATLDLGAATWTGTESARVVSLLSGTLLCQWTWTALDWASDPSVTGTEPVAPPCVDGDGNPCLFDFTVNLSAGQETDGLCGTYGFAVDDGAYHYGYSEDWASGGTGYGPQFAYYLPGGTGTGGLWFPVVAYGSATWTPGTGAQGQLHYEIRKTLLQTYIP